MTESLSKHYEPAAAEEFAADWEKNGYFSSTPLAGRDNYSILLPPPNVTGTLHMGHAFQHTLMDALIRHRRMRGCNTLWQAGSDHAGIATQIVVTRELERRGLHPAALSREEFLRHAWEWKTQSGDAITRQMRRLGTSCDWTRARFTMDEGLSGAVSEAFVRLYEDGLIYRGKRLVNWDPELLTAVSDLEVVSEEEDGAMYYVRYPFADGAEGGVVIGTTRPETILVDGAIAVHPDDERYTPLLGRHVLVPLTEPPRPIEIIADGYVDPAFGSGCVKITAAHDFNDYEVAARHPDKNIPLLVLFTLDAKMNENAPPRYRGLDRFEARRRIVEDLRQEGLLVAEKPHRYKLPRGDRSGVVVEPMLTDQWFVRMDSLAQRGLNLAASGKMNFVPANWRKVYDMWLENIHDWCISRQLLWGHQIPAWYDEEGNIFVARDEQAASRKAGGKPLRRDADVLDTWFSSALWPFSTMDWPNTDNAHFAAYFPTSTLVTGFDIIFFWVARMAMLTDYFIGKTPFADVYITGLVRDGRGKKMSKSRGNVLDPLDLVDGIEADALVAKRTEGLMNPAQAEQIAADTRKQFPDGIPAYGVDALRFTFASLASYGRDIKFELNRCEGYRHFCNKLWNATRFVLGVVDAEKEKGGEGNGGGLSAAELATADDWIESRLHRAVGATEEAFAVYRFDLAAREIYRFFWDDYCDWYVEAAKVQLRDGDAEVRARTRRTLLAMLEAGLRLCHPIIPFITEQLWQKVAPLAGVGGETIMRAPYPRMDAEKISPPAEERMRRLQQAVETARRLRADAASIGLSPVLLLSGEDAAKFSPFVAKLGGAPVRVDGEGGGELRLTLAEGGDVMQRRWREQLEEIDARLRTTEQKLANPQFIERAPPQVVEQTKERQTALAQKREELKAYLEK